MNIIQLTMLTITYLIVSAFVVNSAQGTEPIELPVLDIPTFNFIDLSGGCGGFTDCIEYVGAVIYNVGLTIIAILQLIFELITYVIELGALILDYGLEGIAGAPTWLNLIIGTFLALNLSVIIFRMARTGDSNA